MIDLSCLQLVFLSEFSLNALKPSFFPFRRSENWPKVGLFCQKNKIFRNDHHTLVDTNLTYSMDHFGLLMYSYSFKMSKIVKNLILYRKTPNLIKYVDFEITLCKLRSIFFYAVKSNYFPIIKGSTQHTFVWVKCKNLLWKIKFSWNF